MIYLHPKTRELAMGLKFDPQVRILNKTSTHS